MIFWEKQKKIKSLYEISRCKFDAIKIKQTMPMRKDLQEYFLKDYNLNLILSDEKQED